jgi:hypothetical protein
LARDHQLAIENRLAEMEAVRPKSPEIEDRLAVMMKCKQGFYPEALAKSYGWRMYANLEYFRRAMERRVATFKRKQDTLWDHFGETA